MGTRSTVECAADGVRKAITNYELRITNRGNKFCRSVGLFFVILACSSVTAFAQSFDVLSENIKRGNDEQKRTALVQIRNFETVEASRIAVPALKDSSEIVRATAAFSVIFLPKDEAFDVLLPNLSDKKEFVRRETAYALGKIQNPAAVAFLIQTFQKDKSIEVKNAAIVALGEIGDVSAVDFLTQILRRKKTGENEFERRSAARSIGQIAQIILTGKSKVITPPDGFGKIETPRFPDLTARFPVFSAAIPMLIQTLQNPQESDDAKRESAFALGAIGDVSATATLQSKLNAEDYHLAAICAEALQKIALNKKLQTPRSESRL